VPTAIRRKAKLADNLPEAPGVYQFLGPNDEVLYVGTSINLRKRVRSYFTAAEKRKQITEMVQIAERVVPIVCATGLEAAVRELRIIAAKNPRYNRRSKHPDKSTWVRLTDEPYPRLTMVRQVTDSSAPHIGPYPSQNAAREAMAALQQAIPLRQCTKKLALHPKDTGSPCVLAGLGKCSAPCLAVAEVDTEYKSVVEAALSALAGDPSVVVQAVSARVAELAAKARFEEAACETVQLKAFLTGAAKAQKLYPLAACPELVAARPVTKSSSPGASTGRGSEGRSSRVAGGYCAPAANPIAPDGWELAVIKYGRLAGSAWCGPHDDLKGTIAALRATAEFVAPSTPPMPAALPEEAHLILNWLDSPGVRLVFAETPWALPVRSAIPYLSLAEVSDAVHHALVEVSEARVPLLAPIMNNNNAVPNEKEVPNVVKSAMLRAC
jgi:DNA polymerase-3 subunit epsilon